MKIEEMMPLLREGQVLTRYEWEDQEINKSRTPFLEMFQSMGGTRIVVNVYRYNRLETWYPQPEDIVADDYKLYDPSEYEEDED